MTIRPRYATILSTIAFVSTVDGGAAACLEPCGASPTDLLKKCFDGCSALGHACHTGDGKRSGSASERMSCAYGCEMAYYSVDAAKCERYCNEANGVCDGTDRACEYEHIDPRLGTFEMCGGCPGGNSTSPTADACVDGCGEASSIPGFYGRRSRLEVDVLQTCVEECSAVGEPCGNRYAGGKASSNNLMSCAYGCEIAYYSNDVDECEAYCDRGNEESCRYYHPHVADHFNKCVTCDPTDTHPRGWPTHDSCAVGCERASSLGGFYDWCVNDVTEDIPRFLFAGDGSMIGYSEGAKKGLFSELTETLTATTGKRNANGWKNAKLRKMEAALYNSRNATPGSSRKEALGMYALRRYVKKPKFLTGAYGKAVCSLTIPKETDGLDCERPVSPTACGRNYGPELMFAHVFPRMKGPLKRKRIGIIKVARDDRRLKQWNNGYRQEVADAIAASKGSIEAFVWFHGEFDSKTQINRDRYLKDLKVFVADVRNEIHKNSTKFESPEDVPVVIVELGNWVSLEVDPSRIVIEAQRTFVENTPNTALVNTGLDDDEYLRLSKFPQYDAAALLIIGSRIAKAVAQLLDKS